MASTFKMISYCSYFLFVFGFTFVFIVYRVSLVGQESRLIQPSSDFLTKMDAIAQERSERLKHYCDKQKYTGYDPSFDVLQLVQSDRVAYAPALAGNSLDQSFLYCIQGLTATVGWTKVFSLLLESDRTLAQQLDAVKAYSDEKKRTAEGSEAEDTEEEKKKKMTSMAQMSHALPFPEVDFNTTMKILSKSLPFTFVRHPYMKLVALYQERFIVHNWTMNENIPRNYSREPSEATEFRAKPGMVSFREVLEAYVTGMFDLSGTHRFDNYMIQCRMCDINYFVGKVETLPEDVSYLMFKTGLAHHTNSFPLRKAKSEGVSNSTELMALKVFKTISRNNFQSLQNLHWPEFEAFGYNPNLFTELVATAEGFVH